MDALSEVEIVLVFIEKWTFYERNHEMMRFIRVLPLLAR